MAKKIFRGGSSRRPPTIFPPHTPLYFDYNATTPVDTEVASAMMPYLTSMWGNPSSSHYYGKGPKQAVELARRQLAKAVNAESPKHITFTSGGTESANWAIKGTVSAFKKEFEDLILKGVLPLNSIPHIITSAIEHPCVLKVCEYLCTTGQCELTIVKVNKEGVVDVRDVLTAVKPTTCLVTIMHANNEVGSVQPIPELSRALKATIPEGIRPLLHTDASQSLGKIPVDINVLGVDFLTIAGHKLYAPKGVGALYISSNVEKRLNGKSFPLFMHGGGQESGNRAGTENVILIAGLGKGAELVTGKDMHAYHVKYEILTQSFMRQLRAKCAGGVKMNGPRNHSFEADEEYANQIILGNISDNPHYYDSLGNDKDEDIYSASLLRPRNWKRLPNTLSVGFAGLLAKDLIEKTRGRLSFSAAAACHSPTGNKDHGVSAVLRAMGVDLNYAKGTVRLSIGRYTTESEVVMASRILSEAANELWGAAGRSHKHKNNITAERHSKPLNSRNHRTNRRQKISTNIYRSTVEERNSNTNSTAAERDVTRRLPRYMQSTIASSRNFERSHRQRNRKRGKKKAWNANQNEETKPTRYKYSNVNVPQPIVHSPSWNQSGNQETHYAPDCKDDDHADFNETEILYGPASQNMYDSPAHDRITKSPPPTSIRLSIKKIMKTSEKEKDRVTRIHQDVMNEMQRNNQYSEEHHMEEKRRDYAADGIGNDDWRADFDRVLARSRAALIRAQD